MVSVANLDTFIRFAEAYGDFLQRIDAQIAYRGLGQKEIAVVLAALNGEATMAEISRTLGIDSGQMSRQCDSLEAKGYLEPRPDGAPRRKRLELTPAGFNVADTILNRRRAVAKQVWEDLTLAERDWFLERSQHLFRDMDRDDAPKQTRLAMPSELGLIVSAMVDSFTGARSFPFDPAQFGPHLLRRVAEWAEAGAEIYVIERRGHVLGTYVLQIDPEARTATIPLLCVFFGYRYDGNGSRLLTHVIDLCEKQRLKSIRCTMPASDHGESFLGTGWKKTSSVSQHCCGRDVTIEQWEFDLSRYRSNQSRYGSRSLQI